MLVATTWCDEGGHQHLPLALLRKKQSQVRKRSMGVNLHLISLSWSEKWGNIFLATFLHFRERIIISSLSGPGLILGTFQLEFSSPNDPKSNIVIDLFTFALSMSIFIFLGTITASSVEFFNCFFFHLYKYMYSKIFSEDSMFKRVLVSTRSRTGDAKLT